MAHWQTNYENKIIPLSDAVNIIKSGDKVWAGGYLSVPVGFLMELDKKALTLDGTDIYAGLLTYPYKFYKT
ncbi:hypothetical protein L4D76_15680 [Photobacterium sagamiensis]|uniref:hypothetical protein n=1 Tax=Photobacterium sagamiensis TaxID=2910241 RepID=UPI003D0D960E